MLKTVILLNIFVQTSHSFPGFSDEWKVQWNCIMYLLSLLINIMSACRIKILISYWSEIHLKAERLSYIFFAISLVQNMQVYTHIHRADTLNECSNRTRNGKLTACRMRFSFSVCSICFSFTTWKTRENELQHRHTPFKRWFFWEWLAFCLSRIFMAKCWPDSLCLTSMTRPNEPVPRVFNLSKWSRDAVFWGKE